MTTPLEEHRERNLDPAEVARIEEMIAANGVKYIYYQFVSINGRAVHSIEEAQMALLNAHKGQTQIVITTSGDPAAHQWPLEGPAPRSLPVHPTQLYATLNGLLLCLFLLAYAPFCRRDGELWAMTLTLYPISRFLLEMIRTDEPGVWMGMTISQNVSLILLFCAIALWIHILKYANLTESGSFGVFFRT